MKKTICLLTFSILVLFASQALARELLVLSGERSQNSKRWQEEVLPEYSNSESGKSLPARVITIEGDQFPQWLGEAMEDGRMGEVIGTPTFIIWDTENKAELGRVEGYTQKSAFLSQLNEALELVAQGQHPGKREGSGGERHEEGSGGEHQHEGSGEEHQQEGSGGEQQQEGSGGMSGDIMDHIYKTPEEAKRASEMLGLGGEIHSHESPEGTIYMPGPMM